MADPTRCGQDGQHPVPRDDLTRPASCPCGAVTRHPAPPKEPDR